MTREEELIRLLVRESIKEELELNEIFTGFGDKLKGAIQGLNPKISGIKRQLDAHFSGKMPKDDSIIRSMIQQLPAEDQKVYNAKLDAAAITVKKPKLQQSIEKLVPPKKPRRKTGYEDILRDLDNEFKTDPGVLPQPNSLDRNGVYHIGDEFAGASPDQLRRIAMNAVNSMKENLSESAFNFLKNAISNIGKNKNTTNNAIKTILNAHFSGSVRKDNNYIQKLIDKLPPEDQKKYTLKSYESEHPYEREDSYEAELDELDDLDDLDDFSEKPGSFAYNRRLYRQQNVHKNDDIWGDSELNELFGHQESPAVTAAKKLLDAHFSGVMKKDDSTVNNLISKLSPEDQILYKSKLSAKRQPQTHKDYREELADSQRQGWFGESRKRRKAALR